MGQTHFLSVKRGAAVITKVMSSLKDPELCWWCGGHWILQKLSWKKCVLNYNLKERNEMVRQRKRVIQSKYLDWQRVSWSSEIWLLTWANTHPGRCSGLSFFLIITYNSQLGFPGSSDPNCNPWLATPLPFGGLVLIPDAAGWHLTPGLGTPVVQELSGRSPLDARALQAHKGSSRSR